MSIAVAALAKSFVARITCKRPFSRMGAHVDNKSAVSSARFSAPGLLTDLRRGSSFARRFCRMCRKSRTEDHCNKNTQYFLLHVTRLMLVGLLHNASCVSVACYECTCTVLAFCCNGSLLCQNGSNNSRIGTFVFLNMECYVSELFECLWAQHAAIYFWCAIDTFFVLNWLLLLQGSIKILHTQWSCS
jgi:hypothetical protein